MDYNQTMAEIHRLEREVSDTVRERDEARRWHNDGKQVIAALRAELKRLREAVEKAETGSFRVDAGIERFLERWDYVVKGKGPHDAIMIDTLSDVVLTLRMQRRRAKEGK